MRRRSTIWASSGRGLTDTPEGVGRGGIHVPVLLKEAMDFLAGRGGGTYIDATVGLGGHSLEIAKRLGAPGHLIGLDKDPAALEIARKRLSSAGVSPANTDWPEITLLHASFAEIGRRFPSAVADGILADLGEIGRASCRERVWIWGVEVSLKETSV